MFQLVSKLVKSLSRRINSFRNHILPVINPIKQCFSGINYIMSKVLHSLGDCVGINSIISCGLGHERLQLIVLSLEMRQHLDISLGIISIKASYSTPVSIIESVREGVTIGFRNVFHEVADVLFYLLDIQDYFHFISNFI